MSMEDDEAAEIYFSSNYKSDETNYCDRMTFLAGAAHGRKQERERIYKEADDAKWTVVPHGMPINEYCTAVLIKTLKRIIFGGEGEKAKE